MVSNRLTQCFQKKETKLLNIFFTAGYPNLNDTITILESLEEVGVDMVEIGIPYSDPVADGSIIQRSSTKALENGMTLEILFNQLKQSKYKIPVVLMGYFNCILKYGIEKFCEQCVSSKVSGAILPDLPVEVYNAEYRELFEKHNLSCIFLVTSRTEKKRIKLLDKSGTGFIYAVSSDSTTGSKSINSQALEYLKKNQLQTPVMVGFNIKTKQDLESVSKYANGGIIGSAFIQAISEPGNLKEKINSFVNKFIHI